MNNHFSRFVPAVSLNVLLAACGGGSGGDNMAQDVIDDPNPQAAFFNDEAGLNYVDSMLSRFFSVFRPIANLADDDSAKRTITAIQSETVSCDGGGSVGLSLSDGTEAEIPESISINFNNCIEDGETSNGSIMLVLDLDVSGDNGMVTISANDITITGGEEDIAIDGAVTVALESTDTFNIFSISGSNFSFSAGDESISISDYNITAIDNFSSGSSILEAAMTVTSNMEGTVMFSVNPPFQINDADDYPFSGTLSITHTDGSSLTLNADNGDPETFDFVVNDGSTTSSGVQRWDETELEEL